MSKKVPLGELTTPSTAITSEAVLTDEHGTVTLRFEFDRDGLIYRSGVRFDDARAYRFRAESHCTAWHIEGAYDTIAEVQGSDWLAELVAAEPKEFSGLWEMHHFILYIDSSGCFEVVGSAWALLPDERVR